MATRSSAPINLPTGKTMLDAVMYVATLVSKSSDIDPQLDRVRAITSQRSAHQLTAQDDHTLGEVYDYIEDYLVEKESLRSFTHDSVRKRVSDYLRGGRKSNLAAPLSIMWAIAVGGALGAIVLPEVALPAAVKPTLAITMFFTTINLGAAWMFWKGLENFKDEIRQAYLPICLGIGVLGLTLLQIPVAVSFSVDTTVWFRYISSSLPVPIAESLVYVGMCRFAQIGGVKSKLLSNKLIIGLCVGSAIIVNLIPRPDSGIPNWAMMTSLTLLGCGAVLTTVTAIITGKVRHTLSSVYKRPMAWFMAAMVTSTFTNVLYGILQMIATREHPFAPQGIAILSIIISGFVILKAGTSFRRIDTSSTSP